MHKKRVYIISWLLLIVFTAPILLKSLHFSLFHHDFIITHAEYIGFGIQKTEICAYQHDIFTDFIKDDFRFEFFFAKNNYKEIFLMPYRVLMNIRFQIQDRAPPY